MNDVRNRGPLGFNPLFDITRIYTHSRKKTRDPPRRLHFTIPVRVRERDDESGR